MPPLDCKWCSHFGPEGSTWETRSPFLLKGEVLQCRLRGVRIPVPPYTYCGNYLPETRRNELRGNEQPIGPIWVRTHDAKLPRVPYPYGEEYNTDWYRLTPVPEWAAYLALLKDPLASEDDRRAFLGQQIDRYHSAVRAAGRLGPKFAGCLLGAMVGDVIGALVEGESADYIRKTFRDVDHLLEQESVEEPFGGRWTVGRYTDDTEMLLAVAEWIAAEDGTQEPRALLERLSSGLTPWRRYGPATEGLLAAFRKHPDSWQSLAADVYPGGSYGNGSAIRAAAIGLVYHNDLDDLLTVSVQASKTTHTHPLAVQGATLQAAAVAVAVRSEETLGAERMLTMLREVLRRLRQRHGYDPGTFLGKLAAVEEALAGGEPAQAAADRIGTGVQACEAVPFALYAALRHPASFEEAVAEAVFAGGDTDSIAAMTGAIMGALLGDGAVPERWTARVREDRYPPARVRELALRLSRKVFR